MSSAKILFSRSNRFRIIEKIGIHLKKNLSIEYLLIIFTMLLFEGEKLKIQYD